MHLYICMHGYVCMDVHMECVYVCMHMYVKGSRHYVKY